MSQKTAYRKAFRWEGEIEELISKLSSGYTLNAPCGESQIGDVRLDLDPKLKPTGLFDWNRIPYPCNTFDTVIQDIVWTLPYYSRQTPFFECCHVCKIGGKIIYNAPWTPTAKCVRLDEQYIRPGKTTWANHSLINVYTKVSSCSYADKSRKPAIEPKESPH